MAAFATTEQYAPIVTDSESRHMETSAAAETANFNIRPPKHPIFRGPDYAAPHTFDRLRITGERGGTMGHDITLCQLPSPPSTSADDRKMSPMSTAPHANMEPDHARDSRVMLPALPADSDPDGSWQDETCGFNIAKICATVRGSCGRFIDLNKNYNWYPEAVAVDALLPPGVPLSLRDICIYYPHHVRSQDVMLRLAHNDYRGQDILDNLSWTYQDHMSLSVLNQIQRDTVRRRLPGFKTTGYEGKGDPETHTKGLKLGAYLEEKFMGFTVPSFGDLLHGLKFIPTRLDARGLTQCLAWFLRVRDIFQPKLELNILHAQALIRALGQSLPPVGVQNVNRYALEQWGKEETSERIGITAVGSGLEEGGRGKDNAVKSPGERAVMNIRHNTIKAEVRIPLRNILVFPFLALHGVISEAFEMGINNAERRRAARKGTTRTKQPTPARSATATVTGINSSPHSTPKRLREAESGQTMTPAQTPKRQRKLDAKADFLGVRTPRRPTVSPITPRTERPQPRLVVPRDSQVKSEFGLRQRGPARQKP
ncbi:hypothetical protein E8E12_011788 [Didymella heteroderae]|uniref:Uncharacterized protein n=1 Tax=Didymella heteroderae TaxID=1769908 RepID=A0A9P4X291_9PLEO|nr:hypothetical protein E8E12_011788 [Didymella heteroderae]